MPDPLPATAPTPDDSDIARMLLSAAAVRERAHEMLAIGEAGGFTHWTVDRSRLPVIADYVLETIRTNYPKLDVPVHARWRHFSAGGRDRWGDIRTRATETSVWPDAAARARAAFDLAIVSVLLDAGAGTRWHYTEPDGTKTGRSEGLAVASVAMFAAGAFSANPADPFRADASRLATFTAADLAKGFQVSSDNSLVGLDGRAGLLNALGRACLDNPALSGSPGGPRPGALFDVLAAAALPMRGKGDDKASPSGRTLPAAAILSGVLTHFATIWPSRIVLAGVPLGDTWHHPALKRDDITTELVPFHKLSQWLAYSLLEPLESAGIAVTSVDDLTGLPEYRNGGLLIDLGALKATDAADLDRAHEPSDPFVVEWRAMTVALLDEIADLIRARLNTDATGLPLAKVLEGGTWAAGRRIARERRPDGSPPLAILSDGTVF